jgi:hypothetical protein
MTDFDFTVRCTDPTARNRPAKYKLAAEWIGGGYAELKTYGFADDESLESTYRTALARLEAVKPADDESVGPLRIYRLNRDSDGGELRRALELETTLSALIAKSP